VELRVTWNEKEEKGRERGEEGYYPAIEFLHLSTLTLIVTLT